MSQPLKRDEMSDYEADELERLWIVIRAALKNRNSGDSIEISTTGYEPRASVTIKAYVFEKFIKKHPTPTEGIVTLHSPRRKGYDSSGPSQ